MRTDAQIIDRIKALESADYFGFIRGDLIQFLPFSEAKPFLKSEANADDWKASARDRASIEDRIHAYMEFAWNKANGCRGLSAGRSINHMQAWLWMLGEEDAAREIEDYSHYGKPQLRAICEHFGWDWQQWDDGAWRNSEDDDGRSPDRVAKIELPWN